MHLSHKIAKSLRRFCLDCQGGSSQAVQVCEDTTCYLYSTRMCTTQPIEEGVRPLRNIRLYCLDCAGSRQEVRECRAKDCLLWSYRFGVLPETFRRVVARQREARETLTLPLG